MKPSCPKEEEIPEENPDNNIPNVDDMHRPVMTDTTQDEERAAHLAAIEKEEKENSTWMDKMDDNDNGEFTRCMIDGYGSSKEPPGTTMKHLRYTAKDLVATVPNDTDMKAQLAVERKGSMLTAPLMRITMSEGTDLNPSPILQRQGKPRLVKPHNQRTKHFNLILTFIAICRGLFIFLFLLDLPGVFTFIFASINV